ncbi:hypothetical protein MLD38_031382 [Melastoma candidum]|uniref:Uncharacterized protein n=1 Tax=Melastoma candidum TaxID=119954 RepID=A0ACB9MT01_9MYRT|nr:hypothetical protein MLD38_031382 [Melastoma candidum]
MGRAPCCDKANVKKGPWSPEEDAKLKSHIEKHGTSGNWISLPQRIGLRRCGKSCRLRWLNYLRPNIRHGGFTEEEDAIICSLYMAIGSRWSIIAAQLPGRTDNDIKNYWNTRLKKKLLGKARKDHQQRSRQNPPAPGVSKPVPTIPELSTSPPFSYLPDIRAEVYYPSALPSLPIGMPHLESFQTYDSDTMSSPIINSFASGTYSVPMNPWIDPGEAIPGLQSMASLDDFGGKYMLSSCNNSSCTDISNTSWSDITSIVNNSPVMPELGASQQEEADRAMMQMGFIPDSDFMCFRPV